MAPEKSQKNWFIEARHANNLGGATQTEDCRRDKHLLRDPQHQLGGVLISDVEIKIRTFATCIE